MEKISNIDGLTTEIVDGFKVVKYKGQRCQIINRRRRLCELDTSYRGCVLDDYETYKTPVGVVEYKYLARGAGLEYVKESYRIVPDEEIKEIQERFERASVEMEAARNALEMVVGMAKATP
jgi:hypothetical protein